MGGRFYLTTAEITAFRRGLEEVLRKKETEQMCCKLCTGEKELRGKCREAGGGGERRKG